jgi:hypothetical protein
MAEVQINKERTEVKVISQSIAYRSEKDSEHPRRGTSKPLSESDLLHHIHKVIALENRMYDFDRNLIGLRYPSRSRI